MKFGVMSCMMKTLKESIYQNIVRESSLIKDLVRKKYLIYILKAFKTIFCTCRMQKNEFNCSIKQKKLLALYRKKMSKMHFIDVYNSCHLHEP